MRFSATSAVRATAEGHGCHSGTSANPRDGPVGGTVWDFSLAHARVLDCPCSVMGDVMHGNCVFLVCYHAYEGDIAHAIMPWKRRGLDVGCYATP